MVVVLPASHKRIVLEWPVQPVELQRGFEKIVRFSIRVASIRYLKCSIVRRLFHGTCHFADSPLADQVFLRFSALPWKSSGLLCSANLGRRGMPWKSLVFVGPAEQPERRWKMWNAFCGKIILARFVFWSCELPGASSMVIMQNLLANLRPLLPTLAWKAAFFQANFNIDLKEKLP